MKLIYKTKKVEECCNNSKSATRNYGSEVGKKLVISTPNMTKLLTKLIEEDMVERIPEEKDRRIININLTDKGHEYLDSQFAEIKSALKDKFSSLPYDKLDKFNDSLITLKEVLNEISSDI